MWVTEISSFKRITGPAFKRVLVIEDPFGVIHNIWFSRVYCAVHKYASSKEMMLAEGLRFGNCRKKAELKKFCSAELSYKTGT